jgi:hypothetical protein
MKKVPIEATDEMMEVGVVAGRSNSNNSNGLIGYVQVRAIWDAMVAKAGIE